jgi:cysteine synthase
MYSRIPIIGLAVAIGWKTSQTFSTSFFQKNDDKIKSDLTDIIGNTPLIELKSLSKLTGARILAKAEHLNPGGSIKDRAALYILREIEKNAKPDSLVVEATGGNTGIALALLCLSKGLKTYFTVSDKVSSDKIDFMRVLGSTVEVCPAVPFADDRNFVKRAIAVAKANPNAFYTNQFFNLANFRAHYETTAPEIWKQTNGKIDAVALASGTGGTIAGLSRFLKEKNPSIKVFLIDPPGGFMYNYIKTGSASMNSVKPHNGNGSIIEGIGFSQVTDNFKQAIIDDAITGTDDEAVLMGYFLLKNEGLFLGPSAAFNVVAAVKVAKMLKSKNPNSTPTVVTILCDSGRNYQTKMYNKQWLEHEKYHVPVALHDIDFIEN